MEWSGPQRLLTVDEERSSNPLLEKVEQNGGFAPVWSQIQ